MKILIEISDNNAASPILELLKAYSSVTTTRLTNSDVVALKEIKHIREAHKLAEKVKSGYLKTRPARALLDEL